MAAGAGATSPADDLGQRLLRRRRQIHRFVVNESFADVHRSVRRGLYVASWQRSGSTWLAQIVASMPGTRLVYEPANVRQHLFTDGEPRLVSLPLCGPGDRLDEDGAMVSKALDGSLRSPWMDRMNRTRWATRRVVKDVRTVAVLPWIVDAFPDVPVVLLLRHPVAVAHSILELGWVRDPDALAPSGRHGSDPEFRHLLRQRALLEEVALWSAHHGWALSHPATSRAHVVFYEDLVEQPQVEIERLQRYLQAYGPVWSGWTPDPDAAGRPSATSFRRKSGTSSEWIDSWSGTYDAATLAEVERILGAEHLDGLYSTAPKPLVAGGAAAAAVRTRSGSA